MTWKREGPGALAGASEAETEIAKINHQYSHSRQFRQARPRHIAKVVAVVLAGFADGEVSR
jgi:hypothetical protein